MTTPRNEELREEFQEWLNKTRAPIGYGFPPNSIQVTDFWLSHLAAERTALIEEIRKVGKGPYDDNEFGYGYEQAINDVLFHLESGNEEKNAKNNL